VGGDDLPRGFESLPLRHFPPHREEGGPAAPRTTLSQPRGEVAERLNAAVSKTVNRVLSVRGFESPPLRQLQHFYESRDCFGAVSRYLMRQVQSRSAGGAGDVMPGACAAAASPRHFHTKPFWSFAPGRPTPKEPTGTIATPTPAFTWNKVVGAARFELQVYEAASCA
jgi:hypothetical protein